MILKEKRVAIIYMYMIFLDSNTDPNPEADNEIKADTSRTCGKALDMYSVTAAYIHYGGPVVMNSVQTLVNTVFDNKEIPSSMKFDILNPM